MSDHTQARPSGQVNDETEVSDRSGRWCMRFARLHAGVVTGTLQRGSGNASTQLWRLFRTRDEFRACAEQDQLRFVDPLAYTQAMAAFGHALDRPAPSAG